MTTQDHFLCLLDGSAPAGATAKHRGVLTGVLQPFAARPHVFVTDDGVATTVTIHKTGALDIEFVIATATKQWTATVLDVPTGTALVRAAAGLEGDSAAAMGADLHTLLAALVDAAVRVAPGTNRLEIATATGWRLLTCFR